MRLWVFKLGLEVPEEDLSFRWSLEVLEKVLEASENLGWLEVIKKVLDVPQKIEEVTEKAQVYQGTWF